MPCVSTFVCPDSPPGLGGGVATPRPAGFGGVSKRSVEGRFGLVEIEAFEVFRRFALGSFGCEPPRGSTRDGDAERREGKRFPAGVVDVYVCHGDYGDGGRRSEGRGRLPGARRGIVAAGGTMARLWQGRAANARDGDWRNAMQLLPLGTARATPSAPFGDLGWV